VSLKVEPGTLDRLGTAPSAAIRPTTLLGGQYYVDLAPGGDPGPPAAPIPVSRTRIAIEADSVVESLQPKARTGLRRFVEQTDSTLQNGGQPALRDLLRDAPATLRPAGSVLDAVTGAEPDTLRATVVGLNNTARVLTEQDGQLRSILASLNTTAGVLDRERQPLSEAIHELPSTLRSTRLGMRDLRGSLDNLTTTAPDLVPTAEALDPLLARVDPVLAEARPAVADLRDLLADARPLVRELVPTSERTTEVLDDVEGPVLDRIKGPILTALNTSWTGEGRYAGNSSKYLLYQDIAYAFSNLNEATKYTDKNGAAGAIQVGGGLDVVANVKGLPNFEQFMRDSVGPKESPR
jgi:phospholipid/cholesterol/gamma-HCH transport system substrate-binding protein